jgi:hypothetical protein
LNIHGPSARDGQAAIVCQKHSSSASLQYQQIYRETRVGLHLAVSMIRQSSCLPLQDLAFFMAVPDESDAALDEFRLNS